MYGLKARRELLPTALPTYENDKYFDAQETRVRFSGSEQGFDEFETRYEHMVYWISCWTMITLGG